MQPFKSTNLNKLMNDNNLDVAISFKHENGRFIYNFTKIDSNENIGKIELAPTLNQLIHMADKDDVELIEMRIYPKLCKLIELNNRNRRNLMQYKFESKTLNKLISDNHLTITRVPQCCGCYAVNYIVNTQDGKEIGHVNLTKEQILAHDQDELEGLIEWYIGRIVSHWNQQKHQISLLQSEIKNMLSYTFESKCINRALNDNDLIVIASPYNNGVDATDYIVLHTPTNTEIGHVVATSSAHTDATNFETIMESLFSKIIDKWKDTKQPDKLSIGDYRVPGFGQHYNIIDFESGKEMLEFMISDEFVEKHCEFTRSLILSVKQCIEQYNKT